MLLAVLGLLAVIVLTLATALFVAAEFSLVAADRTELESLARKGDRPAARALAAVRTLSFQLSGSQLGITITTLAVGFLAEPALSRLLRPVLHGLGLRGAVTDVIGVTLALVIATVLQMVFGELVPKNWAIARPTRVARLVAMPMAVFTSSLRVVISACNGLANALVRSFGIEPQEELRSARSPSELGSLVRTSADEGSLPAATANLLTRSLRFGARVTGEVMTPRTRMVTLPETATIDQLLATARRTGHSRFPLTVDGSTDAAGGDRGEENDGREQRFVHVNRAFGVPAAERATTAVTAVARPLAEVPESLPLGPLLDQLRRPGAQVALVVDEWGGTAGLVTLEDVLEELVGEVDDEYDAPSRSDYRQDDGSFVLPGLMRVDEAEESIGFVAPEGPYDTLGGLVMSELGQVARPDDTVDVAGWRLRVLSIDGLRVDQLRLTPPAGDPAPETAR